MQAVLKPSRAIRLKWQRGTSHCSTGLTTTRGSRGASPRQGEVWPGSLDPTVGHEQAGRQTIVIISVDDLNRSRAELVLVVWTAHPQPRRLDAVRTQQVFDRERSNESFDRFLAELDKPEVPVPELAELFRSHPKLPEG